MNRLILTSFLVIPLAMHGHSQSPNLKFPDPVVLPNNFQKAIVEQAAEFKRLFHNDSVGKSYSSSFILGKIDNDSNYNYLFLAEYWIAFHYKEVIPELIKRLTIKKEIGLVGTADLIIWERIQNKQMEFYGHGGVCADDLFTIAGRANRLLTVMTGENYGTVSMYSKKRGTIRTTEYLDQMVKSAVKKLKMWSASRET